jgi:hypothetical protein
MNKFSKLTKLFLVIFFLSIQSNAWSGPNVYLQPGESTVIRSNTNTRVFCGRNNNNSGGSLDCTEECQRWYNVWKEENGYWQEVPVCAFQTKCEMLANGCVRSTSCSNFQSKIVETNGQWQTIIVCLGTRSEITCP